MALSLVVNGITYDYPEVGDQQWGEQATLWAQAVTNSMLQKTGGLFTLSNEVDFGAAHGLASLYYRDRSPNPATAGQVRLGNGSVVSWRNNANNANIDLTVNSSDELVFDGSPIATIGNFELNDLTDVDLTSPSLGELFQYDGTDWVNVPLASINVGAFNDDGTYASPGDNVSIFTNDANYVSVGDNVSDLTNDANYISVGDNVSDLTNDAGYITEVVEDTSPQLGGNLDVNGFDIISLNASSDIRFIAGINTSIILDANAGSGFGKVILLGGNPVDDRGIDIQSLSDILLTPAASNNIILDGLTWPNTDGTNGQVLSTDGSGNLTFIDDDSGGDVDGPASSTDSNFALFDGTTGKLLKDTGVSASDFATAAQGALADTALQNVVDDTSPQLGGDLIVNGFDITAATNQSVGIRTVGGGDISLVTGNNGAITIEADDGAFGVVNIRGSGDSSNPGVSIESLNDVAIEAGADVVIESTGSGTVNIKQTVNTQTGTSYTVVAGDVGKMITLNNAGAITLDVDTGLGLSPGESIDILQLGAGQVTVGGTATVNGTPGLKLRAQYSAATIYCVGTDSYVVIGDLAA